MFESVRPKGDAPSIVTLRPGLRIRRLFQLWISCVSGSLKADCVSTMENTTTPKCDDEKATDKTSSADPSDSSPPAPDSTDTCPSGIIPSIVTPDDGLDVTKGPPSSPAPIAADSIGEMLISETPDITGGDVIESSVPDVQVTVSKEDSATLAPKKR